jgi:hypothetical protein
MYRCLCSFIIIKLHKQRYCRCTRDKRRHDGLVPTRMIMIISLIVFRCRRLPIFAWQGEAAARRCTPLPIDLQTPARGETTQKRSATAVPPPGRPPCRRTADRSGTSAVDRGRASRPPARPSALLLRARKTRPSRISSTAAASAAAASGAAGRRPPRGAPPAVGSDLRRAVGAADRPLGAPTLGRQETRKEGDQKLLKCAHSLTIRRPNFTRERGRKTGAVSPESCS